MNKTYQALFERVAHQRIKRKDIDLREVHSVLISVLTTSPLMWGYVFLNSYHMDSKLCIYIGIFCSLGHMLAPLLFLLFNSSFLVINTVLAFGSLYITSTAYFTGGFESFAILWYVSTPMLAATASGLRGAKLWAGVGIFLISIFFLLSSLGYPFPDAMDQEGHQLANIFLVFGWFILSSVLSFLFVTLRNLSEEKFQQQSHKVDALFRVLFHDLANSLGRINIGHVIASRDQNGAQCLRGLEVATQAADTMFEITKNVRKMYAMSFGKEDVDLIYYPINECLEYVEKIFEEDLKKKNLKIKWDHEKLQAQRFYVEPVSFKNQVLANIVSNAIKFSPADSAINVQVHGASPSHFTLEISDQGIGMPSYIQENLFDLNRKTSRLGTEGESGTGFGMLIMKSFVEMYQGQVAVESVENKGTTFKLLLKGQRA